MPKGALKMATTKKATNKSAAPRRTRGSHADALEKGRKEALKVVEDNLAAIEAEERATAASAKKPAKAKPKAATPMEANTAKRGRPGAKPPVPQKPAPKPAAPKATTERSVGRKPGVLDAAVTVLKGAKAPMGCHEMIEAMFEKKIWSSDGQTPHATLYAAIIREIAAKGKESRFEKTDRGRFQLRKGVA